MHEKCIGQIMVILVLIGFILLFPTITSTTISSGTISGCKDKCGDVIVPFPFGIDEPRCALSTAFLVNCTKNSKDGSDELKFGKNINVLDISVEEGIISVRIDVAFDCYNSTGGLVRRFNQNINLARNFPYRFSDKRNKLTVIGCDTLAFMTDARGSFGSGCISLCSNNVTLSEESSCSGIGCCQTPIPKSLKTLNITVLSVSNHIDVWDFNSCGRAFLANDKTFNISDLNLSDGVEKILKSDVAIEWVAKEQTCQDAMAQGEGYACGSNTNCTYSENGNGYRCLCKEGYIGNPYLPKGCKDIDECKEQNKFKCDGSCKNTDGSYTCKCPLGMRGDGKVGCKGFRITTIATIIGAISFTMIISLLIFIVCKRQRREKNFLQNGGMLLKHQRVRIYSEAELMKATDNYGDQNFLGEGGFGSVYKGIVAENIQVAVKKPKGMDKNLMNQEVQHEIGIISQVNHRNVVKILGMCLQTKVPLLVYEFISNGTLYQHIHEKKSQILATWNARLRVAAETALAIDYLHSLADPPIIHRDIKSTNILLDENHTVKVSDFGASVLISADQAGMATKVQGTFGYLDPEYLMTGSLTEKSDVYSFGVVLVELLTGEKPTSLMKSGEKRNIIQYFISSMEENTLSKTLGFEVADESEMDEIYTVGELAKKCLQSSGIKRPTMKEVAEELGKLKRLHESVWAQQHSEETEYLLGESSYYPPEQVTAHTVISLDIESYTYSDSI